MRLHSTFMLQSIVVEFQHQQRLLFNNFREQCNRQQDKKLKLTVFAYLYSFHLVSLVFCGHRMTKNGKQMTESTFNKARESNVINNHRLRPEMNSLHILLLNENNKNNRMCGESTTSLLFLEFQPTVQR